MVAIQQNDAPSVDGGDPQPEARMVALQGAAAQTPQQALAIRDEIGSSLFQLQQIVAQHVADPQVVEAANAWLQYAWGQAEQLSTLVNVANDVSAEALTISRDAVEQRNAAVQALEELTEAITQVDTSNPFVQDLAEWLSERIREEDEESWYDFAFDGVAEQIADNMQETFNMGRGTASRFADALLGWRSMHPSVAEEMVGWLKDYIESDKAVKSATFDNLGIGVDPDDDDDEFDVDD